MPDAAVCPVRRRIVVALLMLAGMPFLFVCLMTHYCMCGHLAHERGGSWPYINDFVYVTLYAFAFVCSFRAPLRRRWLVMLLVALPVLVPLGFPLFLGGPIYLVPLFVLAILNLGHHTRPL